MDPTTAALRSSLLRDADQARRAFLWSLLSAIPLLTWWAGWYPGIMTSDSIDQLIQARDFEFTNFHPAFHSLYLWVLTPFWDSPGSVALVQALALAGLLSYAAYRLVTLGVPMWLAVGMAWAISLVPAVGPTTVTIWKDVPFAFAMLWAFIEVLAMARDPDGFWTSRWGPLRLGAALALVWLFRHNGSLTVVPFVVALGVANRHRLRRVGVVVGVVAASVFVVVAIGYRVLPVQTESIEPAAVFISDVAASYHHEPSNFSQADLQVLEAIAPLEVWDSRYDCLDSSPLVFDSTFDRSAIFDHPGDFRELVAKTVLRDPDTVAGHRWCAASYLLVPQQPSGAYFQRPPWAVPENEFGFRRDPISDRAASITNEIYIWAENNVWLAWRPALVIWAGALVYLGIALRRPLRRLLWGGGLILAHIFNVAATTPGQEFRFAFPIYLMVLVSLPLAWLVARPQESLLVPQDHDASEPAEA